MLDYIDAIIHPRESLLDGNVFLITTGIMLFITLLIIISSMPFPENILIAVFTTGSLFIGLGTFMTRVSWEYLKNISLPGLIFVISGMFAYVIYSSFDVANLSLTEDTVIHYGLIGIFSVLACVMFVKALIESVFGIMFAFGGIGQVTHETISGEIHITPRHLYFNGKDKEFAILRDHIFDVKHEDDSVIISYTLNDEIYSKVVHSENSEKKSKIIKKTLGL